MYVNKNNYMENLDLVYSLFNQYVFTEAKNNIDLIEYYFQTRHATIGNKLIESLLDSVRKYPLEALDLPLFQALLIKDGKNDAEQQKILGDIIKWKRYDKTQIEPTRKLIRDICATSIISQANSLYPNNPSDYLKHLKQVDLRVDHSDVMTISDFDKIDVDSMIADGVGAGYPSRYGWINDAFEPLNKYELGQIVMISAPQIGRAHV